jgi:hypothetical protein
MTEFALTSITGLITVPIKVKTLKELVNFLRNIRNKS